MAAFMIVMIPAVATDNAGYVRYGVKSGLMRANSIAYGGDEELDKPREDRSTLPIENQSFVSSGEGVFIHAFLFQNLTQYQECYWPNTDPNSQPLCVGFLQSRS